MNLAPSELIINPDGSVYHLHLLPHEIAHIVITVGDQDRVAQVSKYFDRIEVKKNHREFVTHTGYLANKRISVISTGIGTDNIDIVMNELDALVNINFRTRQVFPELTRLQIIRIGTSGSVQPDVPVNSILVSERAIGIDGLLHFYQYKNTVTETEMLEAFSTYFTSAFPIAKPYLFDADAELLAAFGALQRGTTITANGFYAPQGRALRAPVQTDQYIRHIQTFAHPDFRITNLEMETAALYGMSKLLGHQCLSVNAILANRIDNTFSAHPEAIVTCAIEETLDIIIEKLP